MFEGLLRDLGIEKINSGVACGDGQGATGRSEIRSSNPATGEALPAVQLASGADYERVIARAHNSVRALAAGPATASRRGRASNRRCASCAKG